MERNRGVKVLSIIALVVAVIGLTVAFASMSQTLNITGKADMQAASWDIKFANLAPTTAEAAHGHASVTQAPTLSNTSIGEFNVTLTRPGDYVEYTFDVVNNGSINAKIGTLSKKATPTCTSPTSATADATLVCSHLIYTLKYGDGNTNYTAGTDVEEQQTLASHDTAHMVLRLEYDQNATELPGNDVEISDLGITLVYNQN